VRELERETNVPSLFAAQCKGFAGTSVPAPRLRPAQGLARESAHSCLDRVVELGAGAPRVRRGREVRAHGEACAHIFARDLPKKLQTGLNPIPAGPVAAIFTGNGETDPDRFDVPIEAVRDGSTNRTPLNQGARASLVVVKLNRINILFYL
jgi:hypothetical protein